MSGFSKEPQRLHAEQQRIEREIVDVAVSQHEAFTHSAEVSQVVAVKINTARKASSRALTALETLRQQSASIVQYGQTWRQQKRTANDAVTNHPKMMELLEAPSTLELCIRSEMYLEAVLVIERIADVVQKHPESTTLQNILEQCMVTLRKMLQHIVGTKLCGSLNVSQAVKTVSFLQQMGIPEKQVRQLFIEQRTVFIDQLLEEARSLASTPYSYLSKILGVYKLQVADVVSQCLACFSGSSGSANDQAASSPSSPTKTGRVPRVEAGNAGFRDALHVACQSWSTRLVQEYQAFVPQISSSTELHSLSEQTGHCCSLLAKVGLDVGAVLANTLSSHVVETVSASLAVCLGHFRTELSTFSWKNSGAASGSLAHARKHSNGGSHHRMPTVSSSSTVGGSSPTIGDSPQIPPSPTGRSGPSADHPPMQLMEFLPLAVALNGVCSIFNEVRKAVTASAVPRCILSVQQLLERMVDEIIAANPTTTTSASSHKGGSPEYNAVFCRFSKAFQVDFLSHVLFATEQAFGGGGGGNHVLTDHLEATKATLVLPLKAFVSQATAQEFAEATQASSLEKQREKQAEARMGSSATLSASAMSTQSNDDSAAPPLLLNSGKEEGGAVVEGSTTTALRSNSHGLLNVDEKADGSLRPVGEGPAGAKSLQLVSTPTTTTANMSAMVPNRSKLD